MRTRKAIALLALIYCLLGPILYGMEILISGSEARMQALPISALAVFYFAYSYVAIQIHKSLLVRNPKRLPVYYLAIKMIRLILSLFILVLYGLLHKEGIIMFAANLLVYYIATVVYMSFYIISKEKAR